MFCSVDLQFVALVIVACMGMRMRLAAQQEVVDAQTFRIYLSG